MQSEYPQKKSIEFILKQAFRYWSRTLIYQVIFSVLYILILFFTAAYFMNQFGITDQYFAAYQNYMQSKDIQAYQSEISKLSELPQFQHFFWILIGMNVFLYPLNLGLFKIFRKLDLGEKPEMADLFAGYSGINFFIYIGFYMFWFIIYLYAIPTVFLAIIWVFITLFCAPLMFFMNKRIFESISLSIKGLRIYFIEIIVCIFVAVLFKYIGVLTFFGMFFTFPFVNAMIYSLYKTIFTENQQKPQ